MPTLVSQKLACIQVAAGQARVFCSPATSHGWRRWISKVFTAYELIKCPESSGLPTLKVCLFMFQSGIVADLPACAWQNTETLPDRTGLNKVIEHLVAQCTILNPNAHFVEVDVCMILVVLVQYILITKYLVSSCCGQGSPFPCSLPQKTIRLLTVVQIHSVNASIVFLSPS